jgi:cytoskeletal protein RodZ
MPGLGDEFRAAREARHLSLSDVSEQIHIRSVYLQCIEDEEWSAIAAPVYVRGFIRTYARFLGLDPESAVQRLNAMLGESTAKPHDPALAKPAKRSRAGRPARTGRSPSAWLWIAVSVAILLVAFVGYRAYEIQTADPEPDPSAVVVASPSAAPPVELASPGELESPAPAASAAHAAVLPKATNAAQTLVVSVTATSWLLVKVDGAQMVEGIYPAGTVKRFHGKFADIRAGNAGGVDLTVNGKHLGPLGALGSVVDRTIQLAEE